MVESGGNLKTVRDQKRSLRTLSPITDQLKADFKQQMIETSKIEADHKLSFFPSIKVTGTTSQGSTKQLNMFDTIAANTVSSIGRTEAISESQMERNAEEARVKADKEEARMKILQEA